MTGYTDWEVGREYDTRGGWKARVLATDGPDYMPLVVLHVGPAGRSVRLHYADGDIGIGVDRVYGLLPPRRTLKVWWRRNKDTEISVVIYVPPPKLEDWETIRGPNEDGSFILEESGE